jgi:hypothetical protein
MHRLHHLMDILLIMLAGGFHTFRMRWAGTSSPGEVLFEAWSPSGALVASWAAEGEFLRRDWVLFFFFFDISVGFVLHAAERVLQLGWFLGLLRSAPHQPRCGLRRGVH